MESRRPLHPHWCRRARIEGVLSGLRGEQRLQHGFHGSDRTIDDTISTARALPLPNLPGPSFIDSIYRRSCPLLREPTSFSLLRHRGVYGVYRAPFRKCLWTMWHP
jgi:hypothetical protein